MSNYGHRLLNTQTLNQHYTRYPTGGVCAYCGEVADSRDHVPALAALAAMGLAECLKRGVLPVLYPACRECNSLLGAQELYTLRERRIYLAGKIRRRYAKILRTDETSLKGTKGNLRRSILRAIAEKRIVEKRLQFLIEP